MKTNSHIKPQGSITKTNVQFKSVEQARHHWRQLKANGFVIKKGVFLTNGEATYKFERQKRAMDYSECAGSGSQIATLPNMVEVTTWRKQF